LRHNTPVIGDYASHDLHLGHAGASLVFVPILALLFMTVRNGLLRSLWFYWVTVVTIRAAGTVLGDFLAGRNMLGLAPSTFITGGQFVALLCMERAAESSTPLARGLI
jgi:uncharacterized membrane-anchored protein